MLTRADHDVNFSQRYPDSFKEVLRQTMISQELMFKNQVNELHRLYTTQKSLMKDTGWQELNQYPSGEVSSQSNFVPFANQMECNFLARDQTFLKVPVVSSTPAVANGKFLEEGGVVCTDLQQRPIDLQFFTGHYINFNDGKLSNRSNCWGSATEDRKNICGDTFSCREELKLFLSVGGPSQGKTIPKELRNQKVIHSQDITDLVESTETTFNEMENPISADLEALTPTTKGARLFTSYETAQFDLNTVQTDDSLLNPNDNMVANPLLGVFDGIVGKFNGGACSTPNLRDPKINHYYDDVSTNAASVKTDAIESKAYSIDLELLSGPSLELSDGPFNDGRSYESSQLAKVPCRDDPSRSSGNNELQHVRVGQMRGEQPMEVDYMVQKAALALLSISLEDSPASNQDCLSKSGSNRIDYDYRENKPQSSSDSYESLMLKLKDSSLDDDCVSWKPFEVDEVDKKESGIQLRRGRRMKDFQRDILPSLPALSRHEIWEDINIIEGAMRSREYKKLRAQAANEENWFTPVRSRRSRLNYVGRKWY